MCQQEQTDILDGSMDGADRKGAGAADTEVAGGGVPLTVSVKYTQGIGRDSVDGSD
jgi:hypothetical protein